MRTTAMESLSALTSAARCRPAPFLSWWWLGLVIWGKGSAEAEAGTTVLGSPGQQL